ncbi:major facilitator superfamily domain-containing protein 8-like [Mauremys reevesii]|uniref:major facilitator superfamily domain-containing protein 8-like n=1 Tax=Mauremys reevesii TaxID=260615 RepID=UPI00193F3463|nr:major facilitator superfamily domain-containing protein 8-like [Mauremys reevesii]
MEYQRKKKLTNFTIGLLFLSGGIEYAVILPTIWAYLQTLHAEPYFLGLGISAFSLTGLLTGPLFGHWSDRSQRTKAIILFANVFEIVGNFMYFMGVSKWLLLGSRLVAGIGTGAGASIFGYLTRSTTSQERATVFAAVMACRQVGLLIGPACNLFLRLCNFRLGPFEVNKFTSPGLFMCLLWILLQFVVAAMYYDLQPVPHPQRAALAAQQEEEEREPLVQHDAGQEEPAEHRSYGGTIQRVPAEPPVGDESRYVPNGHLAEEEGGVKEKSPFQNFSAMREYLREEVVVLLTAQFITLFNQTALETMVTPITQRYLSFGELENSIMYFLCGIEVICGFFLVRCLSSRLPDRVILVLGLVICNVACIWCLLFLARPQGSFPVLLSELVVGVFLQVLGLPFVAVSQVSLFSKVTAERTQGFSQGLRRSVGGIATILGPLWAGGLTENLYIMLGVMMGLLSLLMVMVGLSYSYLVEPPRSYVPGPSPEEQRS